MTPRNQTLGFLLALFATSAAACDDGGCEVGSSWCEENAVKRCSAEVDCTVFHCTDDRKAEEETDCAALGAFCVEFGQGSSGSAAFCSVTEQPCPTGISSFCVGDVLAVCHPEYDYPEWIVDCREELDQSCVQNGAEATCK